MWFTKKSKSSSKLLDEMKKMDYDTLQVLINEAEDKVVEVTLVDGTKLTIRPIVENKRPSVFSRFN